MKKIIIPTILVFCLLFSGCGKQETEVATVSGDTQETEVVTTTDDTQDTESATTPDDTQDDETAVTTDDTQETEVATTSGDTQDTSETTQETSTEYEVPPSAAANAGIDYYTAYQSVFEAYETIFDGKLNAEYLLNNEFPMQLIYCAGNSPYDNIGYALMDLDNDGIQELLIGEASGDHFYDCLLLQMYTLENGEVVKVISSKENSSYQLCEDLTIAQSYDNGGTDFGVTHYVYSNGALNETDSDSPAQELGCTPFSFYEQYIK